MPPVAPPRPRRASALLLAGLGALVVFCALVGGSRAARAEEAIVLDNGTVLRGTVLREDADSLEFRLAGVGSDNRVVIQRKYVAQRFTTFDRSRVEALRTARREDPAPQPSSSEPPAIALAAVAPLVHDDPAGGEEPLAGEETFFARTARRAQLALPRDPSSRALLVGLGLVLLLCLTALGARMVEIENMSLARGTLLALVLATLLAVDTFLGQAFLRADTATVVLPLEVLAWIGVAMSLLGCGFQRAFVLLAFILMSGAVVLFASAAVLVLV